MFEKIQEGLGKRKLDQQKRIYEREKTRLNKAAAEAAFQKARLADKRDSIQAEKDRLNSLNDKELMVELILSIRGFHSRLSEVESKLSFYEKELIEIRVKIDDLDSKISGLETEKIMSEL